MTSIIIYGGHTVSQAHGAKRTAELAVKQTELPSGQIEHDLGFDFG